MEGVMSGRVLIVGATSSLAQAVCRALAKRGYGLILTGRDEAELELLAADLEARYQVHCTALLADLMQQGFAAEALVAQAGEFDHAILAAGDMGLANNIGMYPDNRFSYQLTIYIFRYGEGTVMAIMHPDNPVAEKSVTRYLEAMKSVSSRVADSGHWGRVA